MYPSRVLRYAVRKSDPLYGHWFFKFYYEAVAEPLQTGNGTRPMKAPVTRMTIFRPDFFYLEN